MTGNILKGDPWSLSRNEYLSAGMATGWSVDIKSTYHIYILFMYVNTQYNCPVIGINCIVRHGFKLQSISSFTCLICVSREKLDMLSLAYRRTEQILAG